MDVTTVSIDAQTSLKLCDNRPRKLVVSLASKSWQNVYITSAQSDQLRHLNIFSDKNDQARQKIWTILVNS